MSLREMKEWNENGSAIEKHTMLKKRSEENTNDQCACACVCV